MGRTALSLATMAMLAAFAAPAAAGDMKMDMTKAPAHATPTRSAYTEHHLFLVKLLAAPTPIPYERYFTIRLGLYDAAPPHRKLADAVAISWRFFRHSTAPRRPRRSPAPPSPMRPFTL